VSGQIDLTMPDPTTSLAHVRAGRVKAYAVMAKTRLASVPEIPTVDEAGLPVETKATTQKNAVGHAADQIGMNAVSFPSGSTWTSTGPATAS
jgi:tripartite-type tricarboxylate transporter receptor subunit TctC